MKIVLLILQLILFYAALQSSCGAISLADEEDSDTESPVFLEERHVAKMPINEDDQNPDPSAAR